MALLTSIRPKPAVPFLPVLATFAAVGWGALLYTASAQRGLQDQLGVLEVERDSLRAESRRVQETLGELADVQAKLASTRDELSQAVKERDQAKAQLGNAQRDLVAMNKRLDQLREKTAITGNILPIKPSKKRP